MTFPDCGNPDCTDCKIVWRDGKRFVRSCNSVSSFESYTVQRLEAIEARLERLLEKLSRTTQSGLVP